MNDQSYTNNLSNYQRQKTHPVRVGSLIIGGDNPICIQSMTDTPTMDTNATVEQSIKIYNAGAALVRITAPAIRDAKNLSPIKEQLIAAGYQQPLSADIHYSPNAAEMAAEYVEKVRINPGNYVDKNSDDQIDYTDEAYQAEIKKIREKLRTLIAICKKNKVAIRVGTNHGSLSNRILSRYGDTPEGMVEATMEFLRIFEEESFHDLIISMKSSNTRVMVHANRLLQHSMLKENMNYPTHLGVTEAGDGEEGRIKSAVGIGTMLLDGIGDTIRVSLTEPPENEIPVAKDIIAFFNKLKEHDPIANFGGYPLKAFEYERRKSKATNLIGGTEVPVVILKSKHELTIDSWDQDRQPDYILTKESNLEYTKKRIGLSANDSISWINIPQLEQHNHLNSTSILSINVEDIDSKLLQKLKATDKIILALDSNNQNWTAAVRSGIFQLMNAGITAPIIAKKVYSELEESKFQVGAALHFGPLLIDGLLDGIMLEHATFRDRQILSAAFGLLQASRVRMTKTEFISCPGCGRTLFDLQLTNKKIKEKTGHLKNLKIGIMGCIVNGPGEMADADFGYVGAGKGLVSLYKNKTQVKKNIPENQAIDELIDLIKSHDKWIDPAN